MTLVDVNACQYITCTLTARNSTYLISSIGEPNRCARGTSGTSPHGSHRADGADGDGGTHSAPGAWAWWGMGRYPGVRARASRSEVKIDLRLRIIPRTHIILEHAGQDIISMDVGE